MVAATTFMVVTNVNKFAVIFFGVVVFNDSVIFVSLIYLFIYRFIGFTIKRFLLRGRGL